MDEPETADILTFDELLEDGYYRSEFEKRLNQELDIRNSHSDVKGGSTNMENIQTPNEGEKQTVAPQQPAAVNTTVNPAAEPTETGTTQVTAPAGTAPASGMTAEQFELYNETLRNVSKIAELSLKSGYDAFKDDEVKASVKQRIIAGQNLSAEAIAATAIERLAPQKVASPLPDKKTNPPAEPAPAKDSDEVIGLRAELALVKAGIMPERLEAAKQLFIAEGGDPSKAAEFVAKYPEWKAGGGTGVVFTKAPPLAGKTAPNPINQPVLNDFEKKVAAARKARGLE